MIFIFPVIIMIAYMLGQHRGWRDGIKVARLWEGMVRDYRMMYEMEAAETDDEVKAAIEVRQLKRMYDGV